jgi:SAM-dependent methyltransferase
MSNRENISILDVGCAGGDFYAYLSCVASSRKWVYEGVDISEPAIEIAKKHYGENRFDLINRDDDLVGKNADIVLSIDVLIHHLEPFTHLERIFNCAKKFLLISLRTRESGKTVLDPELSCQRNYGEWVPFFVFNIEELYQKISDLTQTPLKITCFKEYIILGGESRRFLPKELYSEDAKAAITTLLIEKIENDTETQIQEYEYKTKGKYKKNPGFSLLAQILLKTHLDKAVACTIVEKLRSIEEVLKYTNIVSRRRMSVS